MGSGFRMQNLGPLGCRPKPKDFYSEGHRELLSKTPDVHNHLTGSTWLVNLSIVQVQRCTSCRSCSRCGAAGGNVEVHGSERNIAMM